MLSSKSIPKLKLISHWRPLFRPRKFCHYVNDHTLFKTSKNWRLLGTTGKRKPFFYQENFFIQGEGQTLETEMKETRIRFNKTPHQKAKIAPFVFYDTKKQAYHLFFASQGTIYHYFSSDGQNWKKTETAIKSHWPLLRDPHVLKVGSSYYLYLTDFGNQIACYSSRDLFRWQKKEVALKLGQGVPRSLNSACESTAVLAWKKGFLLFTTIIPTPLRRQSFYNQTLVFYTTNPTDFGLYSKDRQNTSQLLTTIQAHAPEVIKEQGKFYLTTCGWLGFPKPKGVDGEGVFIREFRIY